MSYNLEFGLGQSMRNRVDTVAKRTGIFQQSGGHVAEVMRRGFGLIEHLLELEAKGEKLDLAISIELPVITRLTIVYKEVPTQYPLQEGDIVPFSDHVRGIVSRYKISLTHEETIARMDRTIYLLHRKASGRTADAYTVLGQGVYAMDYVAGQLAKNRLLNVSGNGKPVNIVKINGLFEPLTTLGRG